MNRTRKVCSIRYYVTAVAYVPTGDSTGGANPWAQLGESALSPPKINTVR